MTEEQYIPSKTEFLVDLLTGDASYSSAGATVQRSHRFPMALFLQIENMARIGGVPASLVINQLLECGLEAVLKQLPEDAAKKVKLITPEQLNQPTVDEGAEAQAKITAAKSKSKLRPFK
ncbi:MAG: hypothetical protein WCK63_12115 [Betaproteobacteria bacterium]